MSIKVTKFEKTPNPHAVKAILSQPISDQRRGYRNPVEADTAEDPIAQKLFAIDGVIGVLILRDFITINKTPDATWRPIKSGLRRLLKGITP